jgi:mannose/fructose/N-acetylgalactosamine-specific phosphotransferase system component IIC
MSIQNDTFFTISMWEIYGYIALGLSVLLLSFRFTRFKPWIVSVLGLGVVFIIFAIIANMLPEEDYIVYFYLGFTVLCLLKALQLTTKQKNKLHAGVWLNWSVFSIAGFIPVILKLIYDNTGEIKRCINEYYVVVRPELPIHRLIGANWDLINIGNFVCLLAYFLLAYIPLAYKWQANPSE